jgi:hypothetical protein
MTFVLPAHGLQGTFESVAANNRVLEARVRELDRLLREAGVALAANPAQVRCSLLAIWPTTLHVSLCMQSARSASASVRSGAAVVPAGVPGGAGGGRGGAGCRVM